MRHKKLTVTVVACAAAAGVLTQQTQRHELKPEQEAYPVYCLYLTGLPQPIDYYTVCVPDPLG